MSFEKGITVSGWAVVRLNPWHLAAVFETKSEAEAEQKKLGMDYVVRFGDNRAGTDDFIFQD